MSEFTTSSIIQEDDTTTLDALTANSAFEPKETGEQADIEVFSPADLEALANTESGPLFAIVKKLVGMVQEEPCYGTDSPCYGRFTLCSYAQSAFDHRLAFRLARQALDFLEADYLACEKDDVYFWQRQVDSVEAMSKSITQEKLSVSDT